MERREAMERLARAMERECPGHGEVSAFETRIGHCRGYLLKLRKKNWDVALGKILEVLEGLSLPLQAFLARTFDVRADPQSSLLAVERSGEHDAVLKQIEKATWKMTREDPPAADPGAVAITARLGDLTRSARSDQRKRLRTARKYQTREFVGRYLDYLDHLRYERAGDGAVLAGTLAAEVVALVVAEPAERMALQCKALGVFGSAHRLLGNFTTAAGAIRLGLEVARRFELEEHTAELLQRGAYVLGDHGEYDRALELLEKAQTIYYDLDRPLALGKVLADRGNMLCYKADYRRSLRVFQRVLSSLPAEEERHLRWRLSAYLGIAVASRHLGEIDAAEEYLSEALAQAGDQGGTIVAKFIWLQGNLAYDRADYARSEDHLLQALSMFSARDNPLDVALVSLDLMKTLFKAGKSKEAQSLAKQMSALLVRFKGNKLAEGALLELVEGSLEGELGDELIDRVAAKLKDGRACSERGELQIRR